jgi:hypothetical protein
MHSSRPLQTASGATLVLAPPTDDRTMLRRMGSGTVEGSDGGPSETPRARGPSSESLQGSKRPFSKVLALHRKLAASESGPQRRLAAIPQSFRSPRQSGLVLRVHPGGLGLTGGGFAGGE